MAFELPDNTADVYVTRGQHFVLVTPPDLLLKDCLPHLSWKDMGSGVWSVPYADLATIFLRGFKITDASDLTVGSSQRLWDHWCVHPQWF